MAQQSDFNHYRLLNREPVFDRDQRAAAIERARSLAAMGFTIKIRRTQTGKFQMYAFARSKGRRYPDRLVATVLRRETGSYKGIVQANV